MGIMPLLLAEPIWDIGIKERCARVTHRIQGVHFRETKSVCGMGGCARKGESNCRDVVGNVCSLFERRSTWWFGIVNRRWTGN